MSSISAPVSPLAPGCKGQPVGEPTLAPTPALDLTRGEPSPYQQLLSARVQQVILVPDHLWTRVRTRIHSSWPSPRLARTTKKVTGVDDQERAEGNDVKAAVCETLKGWVGSSRSGLAQVGQRQACTTTARHQCTNSGRSGFAA